MRRLFLLLLLLLPVGATHAADAPQTVVAGEYGLAAGLTAIQESVGTRIVVGAEGRDARKAVEAVMASHPSLQIELMSLDRYDNDTLRLRHRMRRHDVACGVRVLSASPSKWHLVGVGSCGNEWVRISSPEEDVASSRPLWMVVNGEHGLAVGLSAIQERVGTEVLVSAEGREAHGAVQALIVRRPGLQIRPVYLIGGHDYTCQLHEEMWRYDLACGLRVFPVSSTQWKIVGVGQCGDDWADIPADVVVLAFPSPQEYQASSEEPNTEKAAKRVETCLDILDILGEIQDCLCPW
jgi:phosphotransferase system HPr-like phosphotransfer protein